MQEKKQEKDLYIQWLSHSAVFILLLMIISEERHSVAFWERVIVIDSIIIIIMWGLTIFGKKWFFSSSLFLSISTINCWLIYQFHNHFYCATWCVLFLHIDDEIDLYWLNSIIWYIKHYIKKQKQCLKITIITIPRS
jgi:hypothetical protein